MTTPQWPEFAFIIASGLMKRWAEMRLHHLNSGLMVQNPLAPHNTKENILSFIQVYPPSPPRIWSSVAWAHVAYTMPSAWMQLII